MRRGRDKLSKRKQLCTPRVEKELLSIVRARAAGQPEQATILASVDTTDKSLETDTNSPVKSVEGRELRHTKTRHNSFCFQNRSDIYLYMPLSSNSIGLLGCDLLGDIVHGTIEEVLENCLKRTREENQNLTYV